MTNPEIDFNKMDGLIPGIVQDARTGEVLMLGFLNETSYAMSLQSGYVTFWSRTRQKLWMKGESSGNRLRIVTASPCLRSSTHPARMSYSCILAILPFVPFTAPLCSADTPRFP